MTSSAVASLDLNAQSIVGIAGLKEGICDFLFGTPTVCGLGFLIQKINPTCDNGIVRCIAFV
jgi:hypothetical protein